MEQELTGSTPTANLLTGLGVDETFTRTDTSGTSTLLIDALGSTLALADDTAAMQTQYTYEPFGMTTASGSMNSNALQFIGRENDGTGLYYYRANLPYYDAATGRFNQEVPSGVQGGLNLYSYASVWSNPIGNLDLLGLQLIDGIKNFLLSCLNKDHRRVYWKDASFNPLQNKEAWRKWQADFIDGCLKNPSPGWKRYPVCRIALNPLGKGTAGFCVCCEACASK